MEYITGTGEPNTRLDIDAFSTESRYKIQWDLFLRSLAKLQEASQNEPFGYFGVAGIHGWPLLSWPELESKGPGAQMYCAHGNPWFLTWHRAYTLLIEQRISQIASNLAELAPEKVRKEYMAEAKKVRFPIWDFASKPAMPVCMVNPDAFVIIPEKHLEQSQHIDNPLYSYRSTGPPDPPFGGETTRYSARTVKRNMEKYNIRHLVYQSLVLNKDSYVEFSNTIDGKSSIEQPHNLLHNAISIIMADPLVTAFDPIFWVTHVTIDYYFVMWQTLYPNTIFSDRVGGESIDGALEPFYRAPMMPWTSRMVQRSSEPPFPSTYEFGYQYPETLVGMTPEQRLKAVQDALERYAPSPTSTSVYPGAMDGVPKDFPSGVTFRREWRAVIKVKKNMVDSNFIILFFFGKPDDNPGRWGSHKNIVGAYSSLKAPLTHCQNCKDHEAHELQGTVYLTDKLNEHSLHEKFELHQTDPVSNWLSENLHWRIRKADGTEHIIPEDDTKTLSVAIESFTQAYVPTNAQWSTDDVQRVLGYTKDHMDHPGAFAPRYTQGGQV